MCLRHVRAAAAALVACIPLAFPSTAPADDAAARGRFCDRARTETDPARLYLAADECLRGPDPGKVAAARDRALKQLEAGEYAPVDIEVDPPEAQVTIAALGTDPFGAPRTVWLPYGPHEIRATAPGRTGAAVTIRLSSRAPGPPVRLALPVAVDAGPGKDAVDFADEGTAGDVESASDLPQAKHDQLLKDKYRKGLAARGDSGGDARQPVKRVSFLPFAGLGLLIHQSNEIDPELEGPRFEFTGGATMRVRLSEYLFVRPELGAHYARFLSSKAGLYAAVRYRLEVAVGPTFEVPLTTRDDLRPWHAGVAGMLVAPIQLQSGRELDIELRFERTLTRVIDRDTGKDDKARVFLSAALSL